MALYKSC